VVVGEAISSVDGEFTGTLTVNELDSNSLKISTSSDTKTHLYAKSTYISSNSVTYNMLDGSTGDKGDIALTSEWGVKPVAKSSDFAEYLRVKLPGEEWGEHNNPSLYSVSGYGELRCTGIDVRINASMELSDYKTPTSGNDYQELTAPYQLIKTDRNGNVFVFGTLDLSDGALMLPTVKPGGGIQSDVMPQSANKYNIGSSDYYWKNIYVGTIYRSSESNLSTSDRKKKKDFVPIGADFDAKSFLMALKPTTYKFKDGSERTHMGFIAQDVAEAAKATVGDVAAYIAHRKDIKNDEENRAFENISDDIKEWYLDYQEFIAPLVAVVQEQEKRIETLERMIADGLHE
jgi:hypothetical protein